MPRCPWSSLVFFLSPACTFSKFPAKFQNFPAWNIQWLFLFVTGIFPKFPANFWISMPKNGFSCPGSEVPDVFQLWTINLILIIIILLIIIINTISIIIIIRTTMMMIIHADQDRLMSVVSGQKINCHSIIYAGRWETPQMLTFTRWRWKWQR